MSNASEETVSSQGPTLQMEFGISNMKLYDNVGRLLNELREIGIDDSEELEVQTLNQFDFYNYSGVDGVNEAIQQLNVTSDSLILDVGSGLGGPARCLARTTNCSVICIELQSTLANFSIELNTRCKINDRLQVINNDICELDTSTFECDGLMSWLVFLHIPVTHRLTLFHCCYDSLKENGKIYIEDYFAKGSFTMEEKEMLARDVYSQGLPTQNEYIEQLQQAGFTNIIFTDLTESWTDFVCNRYENWVSMRERHIRVHGQQTFEHMMHFYNVVARLFQGGNLGGVKIVATKSNSTPKLTVMSETK